MMAALATVLGGWFAVSVVVGPMIGRFIRVGLGPDGQRNARGLPPHDCPRRDADGR